MITIFKQILKIISRIGILKLIAIKIIKILINQHNNNAQKPSSDNKKKYSKNFLTIHLMDYLEIRSKIKFLKSFQKNMRWIIMKIIMNCICSN